MSLVSVCARLRDQRGFTLVELSVAMVVIIVAGLALLKSLDTSRKLITQSERRQVAAEVAEKELENIQALPFKQIALDTSAAPTTSPSADDPGYYVTAGAGGAFYYRWNQEVNPSASPAETKPVAPCTAATPSGYCATLYKLAACTSGQTTACGGLSPTAVTLTETPTGEPGGVRVKLQRLVMCVSDGVAACGYKRVVVAAAVVGSTPQSRLEGGRTAPAVATTIVADPNAGLL